MEKIFITLIVCRLVYCIIIELFNLINNLKCYFVEFQKEEPDYTTREEFENICNELTLLKSLHLKNKNAIINLINYLSYKGGGVCVKDYYPEFEKLDKLSSVDSM